MQSSSGVTNEVASTGKATQACITEVAKSEFLVSQDTTSLFLGKTMWHVAVLCSPVLLKFRLHVSTVSSACN